jgi:hypothetical protein
MAPSFEAIGQLTQRPTARLNPKQNWPQIKTDSSLLAMEFNRSPE